MEPLSMARRPIISARATGGRSGRCSKSEKGILVLATFLLCSPPVFAQENAPPSEFVISEAEVADRVSAPFTVAGRLVQDAPGLWPKYEPVLDRYSSALDCLDSRSETPVGIDLAAFDWPKMGNDYEINVCLFYIAASLGTPERMVAWLTIQGFSIRIASQTITDPDQLVQLDEFDSVYYALAIMPGDRFEEMTNSQLSPHARLLWWLFDVQDHARDYTIGLYYNKFGNIARVSCRRRGV